MEKTTVYLTSEQKAALAEAAREQGRSEARLIRDGIDGVLRHRFGETPAAAADEPGRGRAPSEDSRIRPVWISREAFMSLVIPAQADAALLDELRLLAPDLTDETPDR